MNARHWYWLKFLAFTAFPVIPLLAPIGYYADLPWLSPLFVFVVIPGLDLLIGSDRAQPLARPLPRAATAWLYLIPHIYVMAWLATLAWATTVLTHASSTERISVLIAAALASAFATCAGHELVHRPGKLDRLMSRLTMATVAYGQFVTEHLHHHATVGIVRAGTTPTFGQSVWSFVLRNVASSPPASRSLATCTCSNGSPRG